ncbi:ABC transporter permease subunit [Paracoccus sp. EF6]|uniref:ABC transporter permease subunit n=1 Tax=Paracoccus benzoatiresistens TaxID=2997341 RepID=A0ABT4J7Z4_9RHOB|nr:ABC transporter permease subunit [Paracoccus sp. EF6]MCZ0963244.1 ABC transporter permease subunit [Paracoccus sp. EF6]
MVDVLHHTRRASGTGPRLTRLRPLQGFLLPLGLALGWELVVAAGWNSGRLLPPPSVVWDTLSDLWAQGDLVHHAQATLVRVGLGFVAGVAAGTVLGAVTGYSRTASRLPDPSLQALRAIPSIAWVPLFILWFGIFETPKIALIAVGVFFPVYLGVMDAIRGVDRKIVEAAASFGCPA